MLLPIFIWPRICPLSTKFVFFASSRRMEHRPFALSDRRGERIDRRMFEFVSGREECSPSLHSHLDLGETIRAGISTDLPSDESILGHQVRPSPSPFFSCPSNGLVFPFYSLLLTKARLEEELYGYEQSIRTCKDALTVWKKQVQPIFNGAQPSLSQSRFSLRLSLSLRPTCSSLSLSLFQSGRQSFDDGSLSECFDPSGDGRRRNAFIGNIESGRGTDGGWHDRHHHHSIVSLSSPFSDESLPR